MIQFYFLSIILNLIVGYTLYCYTQEIRGDKFDGVREFFKDPSVGLVTGVLCMIVALCKFFIIMNSKIVIIGDFVPALCGLISGFTMLLEFYKNNSNVTTSGLDKLDIVFGSNKKIIGVVTMFSAIIHFFFANVLFL